MTARAGEIDTSIPERLVEGTLAWQLYFHEHIQRYEYFSPYATGRAVLDVACGVGYGSHYLATHGAGSIIGVDVSLEAIREAETRYSHPRVRFLVGDALQLELADESVDTVISFETIEHVPDPEAFVREVSRVLRPAGVLICSTPNKRFPTQETNPYHLSMMDLEEFETLLGKYFRITQRYFQSHSPAYLRHLALVSAVERMHATMRLSRMLRLENAVRRWSGRAVLSPGPLDPALDRAVPGDFVIAPLESPRDTQLTYILVGEKISH